MARFVMRSAALRVLAVAMCPIGSVSAQEACSTYVVQDGDTLGSISLAAYGQLDYQLIFNANADVLRDGGASVAAGTELKIPCADGRLTKEAAIAPIVEATATAPAAGTSSGKYLPAIRIATGGDWYPFADEGLSGGGFLIRLTSTAFIRSGTEYPFKIDWVDDWDSHLTTLLPADAFDLSVAWYQPDCTNLDQVSEFTRNLCLNYLFSDSLYDAVFGFFAQKDNPYAEAKTFADLKGARICRPEGYSYHDLDAEGLMEPVITLSIPALSGDCFQGLVDGTYDVASIESQAAQVVIQELGIGDQVVENPRITSIQAIAAMAWKANPRALEYLTYLNRGLAVMRDSGEWNDIVSSSLQEANEKLAAGTE